MNVKIKRALLSVSDKEGLIPLAKKLVEQGCELISTGGTAKKLQEAGLSYTPIEKVSKNPEAFGGRMKTISFQIESALLFRRDHEEDLVQAKQLGIEPIDLVVCNFYPFQKKLEEKADEADMVENVDIGGPTMIRAAAKNFSHVAVCTDPSLYANLITELDNTDGVSLAFRKQAAAVAFETTAKYDAMVSSYFCESFLNRPTNSLYLGEAKELRYGENPHQQAKVFINPLQDGLAQGQVLQGKQLSYNNYLDADAAYRCTSDIYHTLKSKAEFSALNVVTVIKHLNPCGLAAANNAEQALEEAWAGDPVSAFGSIICFSGEVSEACAAWLSDKFVEIIIAPSFSKEARERFAKKKNLRLVESALKPLVPGEKVVKSISGGYLWQDEDEGLDEELKTVSKREFPEQLLPLGHFGIMAAKYLKSNAIAIVARKSDVFSLVGAGMGQPNRIDSMQKLAVPRFNEKAGFSDPLLISDAFYPFADSIEVCASHGFEYLISPGGSIKDKEVIAKCDEKNVAMIFTGKRHFRH